MLDEYDRKCSILEVGDKTFDLWEASRCHVEEGILHIYDKQSGRHDEDLQVRGHEDFCHRNPQEEVGSVGAYSSYLPLNGPPRLGLGFSLQ